MEEWRTIAEFPTYEVSNEGRVRNLSTGRILRQAQHPRTGLWMVPLQKNVRQHTRNVHRLVATEWLFPPPEEQGYVPIHIDGNRSNNRADNLDWRTLSQARAISEQNAREEPMDPRKVLAVDTNTVYNNALEAAKEIGGLERHILYAAANTDNTRYKRTRWEFL